MLYTNIRHQTIMKMTHLFNEYIVVEFSLSQKCFHKHTVSEMITTNIDNMAKRKQTDYMPIGVFATHDLADEFISKTKERIKDYSMYKDTNGQTVVN